MNLGLFILLILYSKKYLFIHLLAVNVYFCLGILLTCLLSFLSYRVACLMFGTSYFETFFMALDIVDGCINKYYPIALFYFYFFWSSEHEVLRVSYIDWSECI